MELSPASQAKYIGWQGALLQPCETGRHGRSGGLRGGFTRVSHPGTASFDACVRSVDGRLLLLCVTPVASKPLPSPRASFQAVRLQKAARCGWPVGPERGYRGVFTKRHIWKLYRLHHPVPVGEGFVMKIVPLFLKSDTASGAWVLRTSRSAFTTDFGAGRFS